eukprot:Nk52_evm10s343 gene=Nk52_evmTU10s343
MGIQGLLPMLKSIEDRTTIAEFAGQTVGIDVSCWLHKGAFACALDLAMGNPTEVYINYVFKRIALLQANRVKPFVVFDGAHLPIKKNTNDERKQRREENIAKGKTLLKEGQTSQAMDHFRRATTVTSAMTEEVARRLRDKNIPYVFAPYEADAQLAYLSNKGIVSAVITEDSDLFVFGCKRLLYKMDTEGHCLELKFKNLQAVEGFEKYTLEDFQIVCILSGCDYLPSLYGVGLKKAQRYLREYKNSERIFSRSDLRYKADKEYIEEFGKAQLTFKHQRVFDLESQCLVPLHPFPEGTQEDMMDFLGPDLPPSLAQSIAVGETDAKTKEPKLEPRPVSKKTKSAFINKKSFYSAQKQKSFEDRNQQYYQVDKKVDIELGSIAGLYCVSASVEASKPFSNPSQKSQSERKAKNPFLKNSSTKPMPLFSRRSASHQKESVSYCLNAGQHKKRKFIPDKELDLSDDDITSSSKDKIISQLSKFEYTGHTAGTRLDESSGDTRETSESLKSTLVKSGEEKLTMPLPKSGTKDRLPLSAVTMPNAKVSQPEEEPVLKKKQIPLRNNIRKMLDSFKHKKKNSN